MSCEAILPFGLLMSLFFSSTAHWTIPLVFTDAYIDAVPVFRVFAFTIVMQSIIGAEQVLRPLSAIRFLVWLVVLSLPVRVAVGVYLIQNSTLTMLALADLVISLCMFSIRLAYIRRRLDVPWSELHPFRSLLPRPSVRRGRPRRHRRRACVHRRGTPAVHPSLRGGVGDFSP